MRLARIKIKGESFQHPFYQLELPTAIPEEEKAGLIVEIKAGNVEAGHRVVLSHVRLALSIAGRYLSLIDNKSRSDDLVSAAVEGLCHGVNKIKNEGLPHDNLTGYLTECIHRYVSEFLESTPVVVMSGRTKRHYKQKGIKSKIPITQELTEAIIEKQFDALPLSSIELDEILDKVVQSPTERSVIELRMEGRKDEEIGLLLGLSKSSVLLIRRELESRFVVLFGD